MPLYEYRCAACAKRSMALVASWSAPDPACPHCGKHELRRQVSTFATVRSEEVGFDGGDDFDDGGDDFGEDGAGFGDDFGGGGFGGDDDW